MFKSAIKQDHHSTTKNYPKTKKINKNIEDKIALFFRHQHTQREQMCIYVDSSQEQIKHLQTENSNKTQAPLNRTVIHDQAKELQDNSDLQYSQLSDDQSCIQHCQNVKDSYPHMQTSPILKASRYDFVQEIDFQLYTVFLAKTKIYGSVLIDEFGRILWCDKMAHEILEGSLNNFQRMPIHQFLLSIRLQYFLQEMKSISHYDQNTTLQWIIYSKNSKRRFSRVPFPTKLNSYDIFYRFLKHLTLRVRPVCLSLPTYRDPCGYCNQSLISTREPQKCFFLQIRYAKQSPNLENLDIKDDPIVKKFLANIKAKHRKRSKDPSRGTNQLLIDQIQLINEKTLTEYQKKGEQQSANHNKMSKSGQKRSIQILSPKKIIKKLCIERRVVL